MYYFIFFRSLAQSTSHARGLVDYFLRCARGLLRPPSTFTFPTTLGDLSTGPYAVLGDCADHRAHLHFQPCLGLVNHSLCCTWGLHRSLSDHSLRTVLLSYI